MVIGDRIFLNWKQAIPVAGSLNFKDEHKVQKRLENKFSQIENATNQSAVAKLVCVSADRRETHSTVLSS